jgi:hypothetical protein
MSKERLVTRSMQPTCHLICNSSIRSGITNEHASHDHPPHWAATIDDTSRSSNNPRSSLVPLCHGDGRAIKRI